MRVPFPASMLGLAAGLLGAWPDRSHAAPAPTQLHNKSIMVAWREGRTFKHPDGQSKHRVDEAELGVYVSSAGRLFMQTSRRRTHAQVGRSMGMMSASSEGPGGDAVRTGAVRYGTSLRFDGRTLLADQKYESGARRITIAFDEGYRSCNASIVHGREGGAPGMVMRGVGTHLQLVESINVAGLSCSVRDGNVFGGQ